MKGKWVLWMRRLPPPYPSPAFRGRGDWMLGAVTIRK